MRDEWTEPEVTNLNRAMLELDLEDLEVEELDRRLELAIATILTESAIPPVGCTENHTCTEFSPPPPPSGV